jgi:hypothetical protein
MGNTVLREYSYRKHKRSNNRYPVMGSTSCVRCGATLIPHSYCDVCNDVVCFTCSSCSMNTVERIHAYCRNVNAVYVEDTQRLMVKPKYSQLIMDDSNYDKQNQLNDEMKYSLIKLSTSYWFNLFECIKLVNRYWRKILNLGTNNSSIA